MTKVDVLYITMSWPAKSETFCARDILALSKLNIKTAILGLKPEIKDANSLKNSLNVSDIKSESFNLKNALVGAIYLLKHLNIFLQLFWVILKNEKEISHKIKSLLLIPSTFWVISRLPKYNPKVVHLFWGHYPSLVGFCLKKIYPNIKLSMFLGAYDLSLDYKLSKAVAKNADYLFTHAKVNLIELHEKGFEDSKFNVVHRGFDLSAVGDIVVKEKDPYKIVVVSRLIEEKNITDIIKVFAKVHRIESRSRLVVVGDGPEYSKLVNLSKSLQIDQAVEFTGFKPQNKVFNILSECSLFLFLSKKAGERLPNAIKEAMYLKVIPITSYTPGIDELIDNGKTGYILENDSIEHIADTILDIWKSDISKIIESAHIKIKSDFDVIDKMKDYLQIWKVES